MKSWLSLGLILSVLGPANAEIVIQTAPNVSAKSVAFTHHLQLIDFTANAPFALLQAFGGESDGQAEIELRADPNVVWAEDNVDTGESDGQSAMKGGGIPAIGGRKLLYQVNKTLLTQINWSQSLAAGPGRLVRVAILDTGLSPFQSGLWGKVDASQNFVERNLGAFDVPRNEDSSGNGIPDEEVGHGTMIAGIVDEIAPQTRLVVARVADSDGIATAWTVIQGLAFAATNNAEVANVSLGTPDRIPAVEDVLDWCESRGLIVFSGIGNADQNEAFFPAQFSPVVCVAGLNPDSTKAAFSNWNSKTMSSAPATGIVSQWWTGTLGTWSGTSFSCPMVAAAVAECLRRTPPLSPSQIRNAVRDSGRDLDTRNPNFRGQLGTLLDIQNLDQTFQRSH